MWRYSTCEGKSSRRFNIFGVMIDHFKNCLFLVFQRQWRSLIGYGVEVGPQAPSQGSRRFSMLLVVRTYRAGQEKELWDEECCYSRYHDNECINDARASCTGCERFDGVMLARLAWYMPSSLLVLITLQLLGRRDLGKVSDWVCSCSTTSRSGSVFQRARWDPLHLRSS